MHADRQLAIIILAVEDVARSVAFYELACGAVAVVTTPNYVELDVHGTTRIGLYERTSFAKNVGQTPSIVDAAQLTSTELYLRVPDLDAAIAQVVAAGARQLSPKQTRPWGDVVAYFRDPDGNVLAVARSLSG